MTRTLPRRPALGRRAGTAMLGVFVLAATLAIVVPAAHAAVLQPCGSDPCDIGDAGGPLTHVTVGSDLGCQVLEGATAQYHGGDCGTFVSVNGTLYGPAVSTEPGLTTPYPGSVEQLVSPSADGSLAGPREVTTKLSIGKLDVTEVDTYAAGQRTYKTRVTLTNTGSTPLANVRLYRAADCAYGGDNTGFGDKEATVAATHAPSQLISISCVENDASTPGQGVESWVTSAVNATYYEGAPGPMWSALDANSVLSNTCGGCPPASSPADNAVGVSWGFTIAAGASVVRGTQTNLAANGATPLTEFVTADSAKKPVNSGSFDGYTITVSNPTRASVTVGSITDYLPTGFTYRPGTTTLVTTDEPAVASGVLTWTGPFTVGARAEIHLHFGVRVSDVGGLKYYDAVSGSATGHEIAPSGPSATVVVLQVYRVTVMNSGGGTVTSTPTGIACPPTCTAAFAGGDVVKLTPKKALGSVFAGWGGDCAGTGACQFTMGADQTVSASFDRVCTNVAYVSGTRIVTVPGPEGGGVTPLVTITGANFDPAWSPNCGTIAFASTHDGKAQIFVMPASGGAATRITNGLTPSTQPTWSSDGSWIAFVRPVNGTPQIFTVAATGGPVTRVTHDAAADTQPDWSPVGPRIVFTSTAGGRAQLYAIGSNGRGLTRLTNTAGTNTQAAWSPTGTRLLFVSTRDANAEIYLMNVNGSGVFRLTTSPFVEGHPSWSPMGGGFAFAGNRSGNMDVFTRTLAGGNFRNVTAADTGPDTLPAWSS